MKKRYLILLAFFLCLTTSMKAQQNKSNLATIDSGLRIELNPDSKIELLQSYVLDISELNFKNEETLVKFCEIFSRPAYTLKGNFDSKKIEIILEKNSYKDGKISLLDLNQKFKNRSRRMKFIYNRLNQ